MKKIFIFLTIFFLFGFDGSVFAVSLSVAPSKIKISTSANQEAQARIIVKNPASQVAMFEIYPDQFDNQIYLNPQSFILESGEKREVLLEAKFKEPGQYLTDISVVASTVSSLTFQAKGGVKIPININVSSANDFFLASVVSAFKSHSAQILFLGMGLVAIIGFLFYKALILKKQ